jgi:hypothetical protein
VARSFNGTTDKGSFTTGLTLAQSLATVSFWGWTNSTASTRTFVEWGDFVAITGFLIETIATPLGVIGMNGGSGIWSDGFTVPSSGAWHHWLVQFDFTTPRNRVWIDGVAQTLSARTHTMTATTYTNQATLLGNSVAAGGGLAGKMAEVTMWYGVLLGQSFATALAAGAASVSVHPDTIMFYAPLLGNSPETDLSSGQHSVTLTGTSVTTHPGIQSANVNTA